MPEEYASAKYRVEQGIAASRRAADTLGHICTEFDVYLLMLEGMIGRIQTEADQLSNLLKGFPDGIPTHLVDAKTDIRDAVDLFDGQHLTDQHGPEASVLYTNTAALQGQLKKWQPGASKARLKKLRETLDASVAEAKNIAEFLEGLSREASGFKDSATENAEGGKRIADDL